jgi:hypothetical protein
MKYIQSEQSQEISEKIHYSNMVIQYNYFIGKPDSNGIIITDDRIKDIWGANKYFLDCTQQEAISQYSLVGTSYVTGIPVVEPLEGTTKSYGTPKTVYRLDYTDIDENGIPSILESYDNCIKCPDNIDDYDLSNFTYSIIEIINVTQ